VHFAITESDLVDRTKIVLGRGLFEKRSNKLFLLNCIPFIGE